jgi:polar amino acid transport system substrate-binding protein
VLKTAGAFTVGTDKPAYAPWFTDDNPANGKGYESAVTYAVAKSLGFTEAEVKWETVQFNAAFAPGPKKFDLDVNQISISEDRRKAVDFSSGYYDVRQTVITTEGSKIANVKSVAELADAKLGAQVGTTSYTSLRDVIKPKQTPAVYDTNDLAVQALKNKQIDGIVVDLPTGFYMTAAQLDNGKIVGQLPAGGQAEQFGFVLEKGSALTACVSKAVDGLKADGTLAKLQQQYLTAEGAPELS